jgi:nucleoid-associated protein YgaU
MKRYGNSNIKAKPTTSKKAGFRHLGTTIYDKIPANNNDVWVVTQEGDRLDSLAHQFYGDVGLWWYIGRANHIKVMKLKVGTLLRIPADTKYAKGR